MLQLTFIFCVLIRVSSIFGWLSSAFFYVTSSSTPFHGVISHFLFYIPAAKASCCMANLHCPLIELLGVKKEKQNWENQVKYHVNTCVYKRDGNSYPWLPLPGDVAVCIFEELARPRVGVCVPLAICLCHGNRVFPSYVAQGGFKVGLSAKLLRWLDPVILGGYHPTLKLSGISTFTLIISLTYSTDNILIKL